MSDPNIRALVERLLAYGHDWNNYAEVLKRDCRQAFAAITALAAENARLREALRSLLAGAEAHIFSTECQRERDAARAALEPPP